MGSYDVRVSHHLLLDRGRIRLVPLLDGGGRGRCSFYSIYVQGIHSNRIRRRPENIRFNKCENYLYCDLLELDTVVV